MHSDSNGMGFYGLRNGIDAIVNEEFVREVQGCMGSSRRRAGALGLSSLPCPHREVMHQAAALHAGSQHRAPEDPDRPECAGYPSLAGGAGPQRTDTAAAGGAALPGRAAVVLGGARSAQSARLRGARIGWLTCGCRPQRVSCVPDPIPAREAQRSGVSAVPPSSMLKVCSAPCKRPRRDWGGLGALQGRIRGFVRGEVAERSKALDWNSSNIFTGVRGFESHPLRQFSVSGCRVVKRNIVKTITCERPATVCDSLRYW